MNDKYASLARDLADVLMVYARERRDEDKKNIARLQSDLCRLRRQELRDIEKLDEDTQDRSEN